MSLVEQELLTIQEHLSSPLVFSGIPVTRSLVLCVGFMDRCLSLCIISFGHYVVCPLLLAIMLCVLYFQSLCCLSFTFSHYVVCPLLLAIMLSVLYFQPLCCVFFDLRILITPLESSNSSCTCRLRQRDDVVGYSMQSNITNSRMDCDDAFGIFKLLLEKTEWAIKNGQPRCSRSRFCFL